MKNSTTLWIIKGSVFLIFIGRAWQHLFWDAPFRSFFWDEALLKPIVESIFDIPWKEYVTSSTTDDFIQNSIRVNGVLYLIAAIVSLTVNTVPKMWQKIPIYAGGISLILLSVLMAKEKFYHLGQFFEHSIQFSTPFVFILFAKDTISKERIILTLKILIALTFFSHGLYAFGFYPVPGKFVDMVIQIFGCSESSALTFLYIAGILDFIVAALIFVPKVMKYVLWYAVVWGLLTAFARIAANFYIDFPLESLHQNLYQVVYRLPHGLIPLAVLYLTQHQSKLTISYKRKKAVV